MNLKLIDVTEENFFEIINLKSDKLQEKHIQIYERWVGSNAFFLANLPNVWVYSESYI